MGKNLGPPHNRNNRLWAFEKRIVSKICSPKREKVQEKEHFIMMRFMVCTPHQILQ